MEQISQATLTLNFSSNKKQIGLLMYKRHNQTFTWDISPK